MHRTETVGGREMTSPPTVRNGDADVAEPSRRIIVDGVDFANVFQFQRVLRAIAMAMQPGRLIIALLMVFSLIVAGQLWDRIAPPRINPEGFLRKAVTDEQLDRAQFVYHVALNSWGVETPADLDEKLDGLAVLSQVETAYFEKTAEVNRSDRTEAEKRDQLAALGAKYRETFGDIEAVRPPGTFEATSAFVSRTFMRTIRGVLDLRPAEVRAGVFTLFVRTPVALWLRDKPFAIVYGIFFLIVVSIGGGAIARMAAAEMATGERLRIRDAIDFALESSIRLIITPLLPLLIMAVLCVVLAGAGAVAFLPWLDVAGGVLYVLALLVGFVIAVLLIGYAAGFSLLLPAIAVENCDAADAQHRAYAYVLSRPFHLLGYALVALIGLTIGFLLVSFVAWVVLTVTSAMVGMWTGNPAVGVAGEIGIFNLMPNEPIVPPPVTHERWAAAGVLFWHGFVVNLVVAYVIAYYFAASTIVYLLIRRKCDGQDITEIWRPGMIPGTVTPVPEPETPASGT